MFNDLITFVAYEEAREEMFGFSEVTFKRDFGPWKAGQKVDTLWFHIDKGVVETTDSGGAVIDSYKFQLQAIS